MTFAERNRKFIEKMRALPESRKKIVLWTIVAILASVMGFFWVKNTINNFSKISESINVEMPEIDTSNIPQMPSLDILEVTTPSNK
jgi:hypothetical protein